MHQLPGSNRNGTLEQIINFTPFSVDSMPIFSPNDSNPFVDGRQSERALTVQTGLSRHFEDINWAFLPELTLSNGRRADMVAVSPKGQIIIVEIKSSVNDFKTDSKWPEYHDHCDFLFFATLNDVPAGIFPEETGLFVADNYGAELLRDAPHLPMNGAKRKSLLIRFSRASAQRLNRLSLHAGVSGSEFANKADG